MRGNNETFPSSAPLKRAIHLFDSFASFSMKTRTLTTALLGIGILIAANPAEALSTKFVLTSTSATNGTSLPFSSGGINLLVSNPVGGPFPNGEDGVTTGGVNTNSTGLCTWMTQSVATGRCNYDSIPAPRNATLTGLTFAFSKPVRLQSFDVSLFQNISAGTLQFTAGSKTETLNISGLGKHSFLTSFKVGANQPIQLVSTGTFSGSADNGVFRINDFEVEEVPAPLPILAAAAAFSSSRKLRRRFKQS